MDQLADELGMDRLELRRKNFITEFPNTRPHGFIYDSGDYHGTLDKCLEMLDLDAFKREQAELRERKVYRGVGFSTYVEICGLGPSRALGPEGWGMQGGYFESATVRVHPTGSVTAYTGTSPHGQGHETGFAQIVADRLGVTPDVVEVIHGDTNTGPFGKDTYGSRGARGRRRGDGPGGREGAGQGEADRGAQARGRGGGHRGQRRQLPGARRARRRLDDAGRRGHRGLHDDGPPRGHGGRPGRALLLSTRRTSSGPSAPTRSSSRSTRRPATSTSSATSRSTTAGRRSTRC